MELVHLLLGMASGPILWPVTFFLDQGVTLPPVEYVVPDQPAAMFKSYMKDYDRQYSGEELKRRFGIFKENLKEISRLNREAGATFGVTKFADMTIDEFMPQRPGPDLLHHSAGFNSTTGYCDVVPNRHNCSDEKFDDSILRYFEDKNLTKKFDWRDKNFVGPVLNQKFCEGCWAIGIVGAMETQAAILQQQYGPRLSIQELIDCSKGTNGCKNGNVVISLNWLCNGNKEGLGVVKESEYPLKLITQTCPFKHNELSKMHGLRVKQFINGCFVGKEDKIARLVEFHGPVIVVINSAIWQFYKDGIIQDSCTRIPGSKNNIDHVVQIVGFDIESDVPHYIVRNSWGPDFGEGGYVRLAMNKDICGVAQQVVALDVMDPL